jgi:hypothetical protein
MAKKKALDFDFGTLDSPPLVTKGDWQRRMRNVQTARRKARLAARRNALQNVVEGLFVARGWSIREAVQMAAWWVGDRLERARSVMERYGYSYLDMCWR